MIKVICRKRGNGSVCVCVQKYVMECRASQRTEVGENRQMGGVEMPLRGNGRQAVVWNFDHLTVGEDTAMGIIVHFFQHCPNADQQQSG